MPICNDCAGGAERCALEGHLKSVSLLRLGDPIERWLCLRCGVEWRGAPLCETCGKGIEG